MLLNEVKPDKQDAELMLALLTSLFKKGELHLYWRIDRRRNPEWMGKVTRLEQEELRDQEHVAFSYRDDDTSGEAGFYLSDIANRGELTKIGGRHALLMTGNFSE